jgi:diguanylate cyclase (GGDEF)-like protein
LNSTLDSSLAEVLWLGLTLAVAALASQLAFGWLELEPASGSGSRIKRLRQFGVAGSLGLGIWATHAIPSFAGIGIETALCLIAIASVAGALGQIDVRKARLPRWMLAAVGLAVCILGVQGLGVMAAAHSLSIDWHPGYLFSAALGCAVGCLFACVGYALVRSRGPRYFGAARIAATSIISGSVVGTRHLLNISSGQPAEAASAAPLSSLAMFACALGLFMLYRMLYQELHAEASRVAKRRERGAQSLNDPITHLPTRKLFEGTLTQAAQKADATKQWMALLYINLDSFKPVNRNFGNLEGDRILREVADRLRAISQPHMTARLGSDEFVILLPNNPKIEDASELSARVIASIGKPFAVDGREANLTCSIGVAMYPEHGALSTLIGHAQAAMTTAKAAGGASHTFFEPRMVKGVRDDAELLRDLRLAFDKNQFELFYQPKIHAPSGEITGCEALIRWNHPTRGMVSPLNFIPIAERYGLINALGRWVIDEACRQIREWRNEGLRMRVAINLSVHQLRQVDLADRIASALKAHQVNPDLLTCELTESSAMDDTEVTMKVLGQLDAVGVHISIDDFGTGHSSLSYLGKLPADELKIDRSFVMDLETNEDARKVALAVINLAKALNLKVVAEGVETEGQDRILREFGCDQLQGYLFAKPMAAKALAIWAMEDVGPRTMTFRESLFKETRFREKVTAHA